MEANHLLGTLIRILNQPVSTGSIIRALNQPVTTRSIVRILNQPVFPPRQKSTHTRPRMPHASQPAPAPVRPAAPAPRAAAPAPAPVASTQAMRTLEEVRTDLARLREHARQRQAAHIQRRRDNSFAPTDFMDFGGKPAPSRPATPGAGFAPTDFMDIPVIKPS